MEDDIKKIDISCLICGSAVSFFCSKNGHSLYRCSSCGLIFVYPTPAAASAIYSADYFSGAKGGFGYVDYDRDKEPMRAVFGKYLKILDSLLIGRKLLDVGAATGFFVDLAIRRGWNAIGLEISDYATEIGRLRGLKILTGELTSIDFKPDTFNVVSMWDVIEHLAKPREAIERAAFILKTGGLLALNTPDAGSLTAKALKHRWHLLIPPEHLFYFNPKNLSNLLRKSGFKILLTDKIGKRFTLQYISQILYSWQRIFIWKWLAEFFKTHRIGELSIPINLRDNFLIIARKI